MPIRWESRYCLTEITECELEITVDPGVNYDIGQSVITTLIQTGIINLLISNWYSISGSGSA